MTKINPLITERTERTKWFLNERFGMFIHWGLYAIPARGEWVKSKEKMSDEEYQKYFDDFDPVDFDPRAWARAAKNAGMKYAVMTAKHHDGFCLFDSKLTDYKATNTKSGRDLVGEYLEAFRAEGLKVGLYYSLIDWHHEHYPTFGDKFHPMRENEAFKNNERDTGKYVEYLHGQVKELLTNYGKLDIMWFDFSYDNMAGETWKANDLAKMIRSIQPHLIIDNRLDHGGELSFGGSIQSKNPNLISGDFASPEQVIPPEGLVDEDGDSIPWEACVTLNRSWGFNAFDNLYKSPKLMIRKLVECVSKNGNMLVNVGPDAKGRIPKESLDILSEVGKWIKENRNSIYGCGSASFDKPEWGRYTQKGNKLYAHLFDENIGPYNLKGLNGKVKSARFLNNDTEVSLVPSWVDSKDVFLTFGKPFYQFFPLLNDIDTVVEIELL